MIPRRWRINYSEGDFSEYFESKLKCQPHSSASITDVMNPVEELNDEDSNINENDQRAHAFIEEKTNDESAEDVADLTGKTDEEIVEETLRPYLQVSEEAFSPFLLTSAY
ncbi:hypothetical protein RMATCC62417_10275 [Rhizopus microsporus]|nr:hypothetical protein RMATCC62417_10275 [Rhizopus microsporus]